MYLRDAIARMPDVAEVSRVYESVAMGGPAQPPYLNMVLKLETGLPPRSVFEAGIGCEYMAFRKRDKKWGPRTLDVDLLLYGRIELDTEDLVIPHPRMWERPFVLAPLADVGRELVTQDQEDWARAQVEMLGEL